MSMKLSVSSSPSFIFVDVPLSREGARERENLPDQWSSSLSLFLSSASFCESMGYMFPRVYVPSGEINRNGDGGIVLATLTFPPPFLWHWFFQLSLNLHRHVLRYDKVELLKRQVFFSMPTFLYRTDCTSPGCPQGLKHLGSSEQSSEFIPRWKRLKLILRYLRAILHGAWN